MGPPKKPDSLLLKEVPSDEKETFRVMLTSFDEEQEAADFMRLNNIDLERVVFFGKADAMTENIAKASVSIDAKKQMEALMRKSLDLYGLVKGGPTDVHYMDYGTGEHTILNDAIASFRTALLAIDAKEVALIHVQPQREQFRPQAARATTFGASRS